MELLKDFKQYIMIIVITVVLGYFLGITVSTVVDYRLKEAVINLPKQRHNITVNLDENKKREKITKVEGFKCGKKTKKEKTNNNNVKKKKSKNSKNSKNSNKSNVNEGFMSSPDDVNLNAYAEYYNKVEDIDLTAANLEDAYDSYATISEQ